MKIVTQENSQSGRGWNYVSTTYATKGQIAIVSSEDVGAGSSSGSSVGVGYTATSAQNPSSSTCSALDDAISQAEAARDNAVAIHEPLARGIMALSATLRENRAGKQMLAWSLLQASRSLRDDIEKLTKQVRSLQNTDLSKYDE